MKPLNAATVDFEPIEQSMRDLCRESSDYYFQKTTGKVIVLPKGVIRFLTQESVDGRKDHVTDWDASMIPVARQIILEGSMDFARIPEAFGQPEHSWMKEFSGTIRSAKLKQQILQALRGRGACKRFKEILKEFPEESRQWSHFRSRCWKEKIQTWLEQYGILAVENNPKRPRPASR
jgi:hypothetical protein